MKQISRNFLIMSAEKSIDEIYFLRNINILIEKSEYVKNKSQLAKKIGISEMTFSSMAKRGTIPSVDVTKKCATFFHLTLDDILYKDLSTEFNTKSITIPLYNLSDLKEPTATMTIPINVSSDVFGISITKNDSLVFENDIFIFSKNVKIKNYDYVLISHDGKNSIKQIVYKNLNAYFANIDNVKDLEILNDYIIIGKVVTKVIN